MVVPTLLYTPFINSTTSYVATFCTTYNLAPFPLTELMLCRFVVSLVNNGLSYNTIHLYLSALRHRQLMDGGADPALHSLHQLHYVLRGCHRSLLLAVRQKRLPITPSILRLIHHSWSTWVQDFNTCMWAACCTGFFGFLPMGEFTCTAGSVNYSSVLSLCDVSIDSQENPSMVHLMLRLHRHLKPCQHRAVPCWPSSL